MSDHIPKVSLDEYLTCQVCANFSVSPIYSCEKGHVVCGICYDTVKTCHLCLRRLTENGLIERILVKERVRIPCRNSGCPRKIKPSEMKTHLPRCGFKPIRCLETSTATCIEKTYCPFELLNHWIDHHKISKLEIRPPSPNGGLCTAVQNQLLIVDQKDCRTRISYFEYEGNTFFVHVVKEADVFHIWVTQLGLELTDRSRREYDCSISLYEGPRNRSPGLITWKFPIHSLQYYDLNSIKALGHVGIVYSNTLKMRVNPVSSILSHWTFLDFRIELFHSSSS